MKEIPQFNVTIDQVREVIERMKHGKPLPDDHKILQEFIRLHKFVETLIEEDDEYVEEAFRQIYGRFGDEQSDTEDRTERSDEKME